MSAKFFIGGTEVPVALAELKMLDIERTHAHVQIRDVASLGGIEVGKLVELWVSMPKRWGRLRSRLYHALTGRAALDWHKVFVGRVVRFNSGGEIQLEDAVVWMEKRTINPDTGVSYWDARRERT